MGSKKKVTIGYKYFLGMHMVICHGPVDSVQKIIVGEREAWAGNVTSSGSIIIAQPELFGGEKKEGGIAGLVDIMMGEPTQAKNAYLQSKIQTMIPAFRGVLSLVLEQCYVCAMSAYPKAWAVKVKRIPAKTWYPAKAEINGSANPVHVIYDTLTNTDWGMGVSTTLINDTKFKAAADTCFSEGLGVSMLLSNQDSIEKFIYEVLGHCNGMFYIEPTTGQFAIKLLREDYVASGLPLFDESNVVTLESFDRPTYSEIVNEVIVVYRPQGGISDDSVTVQDLASIQAQGGIVSQTSNYPGCDTAANAARLAMRDLRQKSTPLARLRLKVTRKAWDLSIGDVFKFTWVEHGLVNIVCRVLSMNAGTLGSGTITIDAAEDIFGLPSTTYVGNQTNLWSDPIQPPVNFTNRSLREASYYELTHIMDPTAFSALDPLSAYAIANAGEMSQYAPSYELWTCATNSISAYTLRDLSSPTPKGNLIGDITQTQTSISITSMTGTVKLAKVGQYCYIDNEIVRLDAINYITGDLTIARGCSDTVPALHLAGAVFWFSEAGFTFDSTEWAVGGGVYACMLMRTSSGLYALSSASSDYITMVGRFIKPFPPGNFKVNGAYYPVGPITTFLEITWSHRDRVQQADNLIDFTAASVGPETGTTYSLEIRRASDNVILESSYEMAATVTSFTSTLELRAVPVKILLWSVNATRASYQTQTHTVTLDNLFRLLTEDDNYLTAENNDYLDL